MSIEDLGPRIALVGPESTDNIRLVETLQNITSEKNIFPFLRSTELVELTSQDAIDIVFVDLFTFDLKLITDAIGLIRQKYPVATFAIYIDKTVANENWHRLPTNWKTRLQHYVPLYKEDTDIPIEPIVRSVITALFRESLRNRQATTWTPQKQLPQHSLPGIGTNKASNSTVFISYARKDWDAFVSQLVKRLQQQRQIDIWIDQDMLVGGEDWMNAIGKALSDSRVLTLVVSPEALASRYVKMEYRYFFNQEKPIIPLLIRPTELLPELALYQHIDFINNPFDIAFEQYMRALRHALNQE